MPYFVLIPMTLSALIQIIFPWILVIFFEARTGLTLGYYDFGWEFHKPMGYLLNIVTTIV